MLVRARVKKATLLPSYVDPEDEGLIAHASGLLGLFEGAREGQATRGSLEEQAEEMIGDDRRMKLFRGLIKVLMDRASFGVVAPVPPAELRQRVFRLAGEMGPLALERGPLGRAVAEDVFARVAEELGLKPALVAESLYADRKSEQRMSSFSSGDASWLLHRYNVALVQALLLKAVEVRLRLVGPDVPRLRQLLRYVKFHQLMHRVERKKEVIELVLDGPTSLFAQSTRYGLQLANFLPAVLLQTCPWTMTATVLWTQRRIRKTLLLSSDQALRSHYQDRGAYETAEEKAFEERFAAHPTDWRLSRDTVPINLGGRALMLPDFTFTQGGRTAHLEIIGFWRKDYLERRLELLARFGPGNLVLAVSRKLSGGKESLEGLGDALVPFTNVVPVREVMKQVELLAR